MDYEQRIIIPEKKRVVIETPYFCLKDDSPDQERIARNILFAKACVNYSLFVLDEDPFSSQLMLAQPGIADDSSPEERSRGIDAGLNLSRGYDVTKVYFNYGVSNGMRYGIEFAKQIGRPVEMHHLPLEILEMVKERASKSSVLEAWAWNPSKVDFRERLSA